MIRFLSGLTIIVLAISLFIGCGRPPEENEFLTALTVAAGATRTALPASPPAPTAAPSQTVAPAVAGTPEACLGEAILNSLNMRRTPAGDIIGCCLALGERVEIRQIDESGVWALIEGIDQPAHRGWVALKYLKFIGECGLGPAGE